MSITREEILHIAQLARLRLEEEEVEPLCHDLQQIVEYVAELGRLDTDAVSPTAHIGVQHAPFREDLPRPGLSPAQAFAEAPAQVEGGFAVPAFVDE